MLVSGKLELDYCVFARGNTPARPMFLHWIQELKALYPSYMVTFSDITQLQLVVDPKTQEDFLGKGIVISLISEGVAVVVKKQTVELAIPDSKKTLEEVTLELRKLADEIQVKHKECLITSRMVITSFVNEFVAV